MIKSSPHNVQFKKGSKVSWKWGSGVATGEIVSIYTKKVTKSIKGEKITRNGTGENPALYIKQQDGDKVLKLSSECEHA